MTATQLFTIDQIGTVNALLVQAQRDGDLRSRLLGAPKAVLGEAGVSVPAEIDLRTIDGAQGSAYLVLPPAPAEGEVSDSDLADAAGGTSPMVVTAITYSIAAAATIYYG